MMFSRRARRRARAPRCFWPRGRAMFASGQLRADFSIIKKFMATTSFTKKSLGLARVEATLTPTPIKAGTLTPTTTKGETLPRKPKLGASRSKKRDIPEGLWTKCPKCETMVFDKELDENLKVC